MRASVTALLAAFTCGLALLAIAEPSLAAPLSLGSLSEPAMAQDDGLVQKAHGWHCQARYSNRLGWHRHWRACEDWQDRHPDRTGCWLDVYGRWHCMENRHHRHPKGCVFTTSGIYCNF